MCWNAPVSLATFIISSLMCLYLWFRNLHNDRVLSIWIFWFSLMQLLEFFMWRNMNDNSVFSKLALINIFLQPFMLATALLYYSKNVYNVGEKVVLGSVIGISFIKAVSATFHAFVTKKNKNWLSVKGPHCHLVWWFMKNSNQLPYLTRVNELFMVPLSLATLLIKPFSQGLIYFLLGFFSHSYVSIFYPQERGSLWCWIAIFMGVIAIMLPSLKL